MYRVPTPYLAGTSWELDTLDTLPTNTATEPFLVQVPWQVVQICWCVVDTDSFTAEANSFTRSAQLHCRVLTNQSMVVSRSRTISDAGQIQLGGRPLVFMFKGPHHKRVVLTQW